MFDNSFHFIITHVKCCLCHNLLHFTFICKFLFSHFQALATSCNKMCFTICKVPMKFVSLQNWLCVSLCFFVSRFLFFICKVFGFCKVLCVVERCDFCKSCHLAIVTTLSSYWCTSFLLAFFFFFQRVFFGLLIYLLLRGYVVERYNLCKHC